MSKALLHYIHDPLCGWCYGSSPLLGAVRDLPGLELRLHAGGMLAGASRQQPSPQLQAFILEHARRITALAGQPFGEAYTSGLLRDPTAWLDSEPPIVALLAFAALGRSELDFLLGMQRAHFVEGARISEPQTLHALAEAHGAERAAFADAYASAAGTAVRRHIETSRELLARVGGRGFPTFVLESRGGLQVLDHSGWLGRPEAWRAAVESSVDAMP